MSIIVGLGGLILTGISLIPPSIGFGTVGVVAGSAAAGIQAGMGSVAAGSWFAIITSLAILMFSLAMYTRFYMDFKDK